MSQSLSVSLLRQVYIKNEISTEEELVSLFHLLGIPYSSEADFEAYLVSIEESKSDTSWEYSNRPKELKEKVKCTFGTDRRPNSPVKMLLFGNILMGLYLLDIQHQKTRKDSFTESLVRIARKLDVPDKDLLNSAFCSQEEDIQSTMMSILNEVIQTQEDFYWLCASFSIPLSFNDSNLSSFPESQVEILFLHQLLPKMIGMDTFTKRKNSVQIGYPLHKDTIRCILLNTKYC